MKTKWVNFRNMDNEHIDRRRILLNAALLFGVALLSKLLYKFLGINELDVVVSAKHFVDPSWIAGDWYLGQRIGYRTLFNLIFGGAATFLSLPAVILLGRLIILGLFALAVSGIAEKLRIKIVALLPIYIYFLSNQSMFAGEWAIGGLETKPFAYCFLLFALLFAMRKKPTKAALFAGLAVSFHVLVGLYGGFCIAAAAAIVYRKDIIGKGLKGFLKPTVAYLIAGGFGVYSVAQYLATSSGADKALAGEIYVLYRVTHHVLPSAWANGHWLPMAIFSAAILVAGAILVEERALKLLFATAACGFLFFGIGTVAYFAGKTAFLRFYWFRFADTFTPFALGLAISVGLSRLIERTKRARLRRAILLACIALSATAITYSAAVFAGQWRSIARARPYRFARVDDEKLGEMLIWISENSPKSAVFLVSPTMEEFYYLAERPMFVSLKHSPQNDEEIIEWFDRVKLCNGGVSPPAGIGIFGYSKEVENNFYRLEKGDLRKISDRYRIDYYLDRADAVLDYPIVHENGNFRLYRIVGE